MTTFSHIVDHATELHLTELGSNSEPNVGFSESLQRTVSSNSSQDFGGDAAGGEEPPPVIAIKRPKSRYKGGEKSNPLLSWPL